MKKLLTAAAVALGLSMGSAQAADPQIIMVTHGQANDPFWTIVKNGAEQAAKDSSAKVDYRAPETFDMVAMAQLIEAAVAQEPDGLVVSIPDGDALSDAISKAINAGIPVVSINSGSDVAGKLGAAFHVGQEEFDAGFGAGKRMADAGQKKGICVNMEVGNVALDLRCEGFAKGFGGNVTVLPTSNDPQEILSKVKAALEKDGDIDTILTLSASLAAEPALEAIKATGNLGTVKLGTFDLSGNALKAVAAGEIEFCIDQQPYLQGYMPVVSLALQKRTGVLAAGNVPTGPGFVTKANAEMVIDLATKGIR